MEIKAIKFREGGFATQPFAFGGEEGFENFDTTYGVGIDWLDAAEEEVDQTALAIWMNENIDGEEIIKYLKVKNFKKINISFI